MQLFFRNKVAPYIMAFRGLGTRLKDVINRNTYLGSCEIVPYIIAHRVQWNCSQ